MPRHAPACESLGCFNSFSVFLRPSGQRFAAGRYDVRLTRDGDSPLSCSFVVSNDPADCASGHCVKQEDCNAVYLVGYQDSDKVWIDYPMLVDHLDLEVDRDGVPVGSASFQPVYSVRWPNGPRCPPRCVESRYELMVE